jgi:hypothetical protein
MIPSPTSPQAGEYGGTKGRTEMEWEEALLTAWGEELPSHRATYYRRKAARAREIAEEVTTRVMKARLLEEAAQCDRLAAIADCAE